MSLPAYNSGERRRKDGFTLVEILVACAIFLTLAAFLVSILGGLTKAWLSGQAKMLSLQNGRAIVDFVGRDLMNIPQPVITYAGANYSLAYVPGPIAFQQFVQNAGNATSGLDPWLTDSGLKAVPNTDNFFGQMRGDSTTNGNLWIVGYFLAADTNDVRRLYRTVVSPAADSEGKIYRLYNRESGASALNDTSTNSWIYSSADTSNIFAPYSGELRYGTAPIAENVLAFYVSCLDHAGQPIPWLRDKDSQAAPLKFNSAARFSMLTGAAAADAVAAGRPSFVYGGAGTLQAHKLPAAIQIHLLVTDDAYRKRAISLPDPPSVSNVDDIPVTVEAYRKQLEELGVRSIQHFAHTIELDSRP